MPCYAAYEHVSSSGHLFHASLITHQHSSSEGSVLVCCLTRSVFYLPAPLPLNHLVTEMYQGPTLVLQGARDPLNDAPARAAAIAAACSNVRVHLLNGGHCPHDESPAAFNEALLRFVREVSMQRVAGPKEVAAVC